MKGQPMICNSCTVLVIYSFSYNGSMLRLCPVVAAILDCLLTKKNPTKSRLPSTKKTKQNKPFRGSCYYIIHI